jgi:hypothetical protein
VHFGKPHIVFWIPIIFLPNFLMVGKEYGTAKKLYAMPALMTISIMLIFCLIVAG